MSITMAGSFRFCCQNIFIKRIISLAKGLESLWICSNSFQDDSRMFHWTAALKEEKLLFNFFKRLKFNKTDRYPEFRYFRLGLFRFQFCDRMYLSSDSYLSAERKGTLSDATTDQLFSTTPRFCPPHQVWWPSIYKKQTQNGTGVLAPFYTFCWNEPFVTPGDSWHLLHNHAGEKLAALFQPQLISMVPSTGTINVVESEKFSASVKVLN